MLQAPEGPKSDFLPLRPRQINLAFSPKNIAVEVGDPLATSGGHVEITDRKLDLRRHVSEIKLREFVYDVGGRCVAECPIQSDFLEFVEQGIRFPHVIWVAQLTNQIGSAQQQSFLLVEVIDLLIGWSVIGKTRIFDRSGNSSRVDCFYAIETFDNIQ